MAKNWRLAVCKRWFLSGALLLYLSIVYTGVIEYFVFTRVDEYPARRLEKRISAVKVGMSVAELERILGPPDAKVDKGKGESQNLVKGGSSRIVDYRYSAKSRSRESWTNFKGIFVDENTGKVASIDLSTSWSFATDSSDPLGDLWPFLIAVGLMVLVVLVVLLFFSRWCRSVTDAAESKERSAAQEAQAAQPR